MKDYNIYSDFEDKVLRIDFEDSNLNDLTYYLNYLSSDELNEILKQIQDTVLVLNEKYIFNTTDFSLEANIDETIMIRDFHVKETSISINTKLFCEVLKDFLKKYSDFLIKLNEIIKQEEIDFISYIMNNGNESIDETKTL